MVGILALQGDYAQHAQVFKHLDIKSKEIRYPEQLIDISGLVIPGGESTVMSDLMGRMGLNEPILHFSKKKPVLGTCAGLIMMAKKVNSSRKISSLGILDIEVDRNAYGRQLSSFNQQLKVKIDNQSQTISATFIRAPKISKINKNVEIISSYQGNPVAVKQGLHIGLAFHPELDDISLFHQYIFINQFKVLSKG